MLKPMCQAHAEPYAVALPPRGAWWLLLGRQLRVHKRVEKLQAVVQNPTQLPLQTEVQL